MHFLCLHGMGTNNAIFQLQTSMIRHQLGSEHTYDWVEGAHDSPAAPGMDKLLESSSSDSSLPEFFAFLSSDPAELASSASTALNDLAEYVAAEGPFDGVMAFSQGAGLAASLMIQQAQKSPTNALLHALFKCAIFFSGGVPGDPSSLKRNDKTGDVTGPIRLMSKEVDGVVIHVPTAHVWGNDDQEYPHFGPVLAGLCSEANSEIVVWDGGHEIPGLRGRKAVDAAVEAIRKTIARAEEDQ